MKRTLQECRIRGVKTNIPFLLNVLSHPVFETGIVTTSFIDENPDLKKTSTSFWDFASEEQADPRKLFATERLVRYIANLAVNGHPPELGADSTKIEKSSTGNVAPPTMPADANLDEMSSTAREGGMRGILLAKGPAGFAKFVREHKGLLVTDTTWRDAHQSLFATRMRTQDLLKCAEFTNKALANAFSMESKYIALSWCLSCTYMLADLSFDSVGRCHV
jgi:pyruvate carboxylase